jgi:S1-C subfamily serine protease
MGYDQDQSGVVVTDLGFDSEAADKGVRPNVLVTGVNGKRIRHVGDWNKAIADLEPGDPVKLDLVFGGGQSTSIFLRVPEE